MLVTFTFKKASILATVIVMTLLVVCISVSVTRFFDRQLCIKQNNLNIAKISVSSKGINADNKTDVGNSSKKKQEIDGDAKKNDNKNSIFNKNVEVVKSDIKKDIQSDVGKDISRNDEKQAVGQGKITIHKNKQHIVALGEDEKMDVELQKTEEDMKKNTIVNTRKGDADDKVVSKHDIIVNINIIKEKQDKSETKKNTKYSTKKENKGKKVVKTQSIKRISASKKNEVKIKQKIVKKNNNKKKVGEKKSHNANNLTSRENKNGEIKPKAIQEDIKHTTPVNEEVVKRQQENADVVKPEYQGSNKQIDDEDNEEISEVYNDIIIGDE